jgi:hypothetical protein
MIGVPAIIEAAVSRVRSASLKGYAPTPSGIGTLADVVFAKCPDDTGNFVDGHRHSLKSQADLDRRE